MLIAGKRSSKAVYASALSSPGVLLTRRAAAQKLSPVELCANTTARLRPVPRGPFVAATYVSISATCPSSCVFKDAGCYAQNGFIRRFTRPLDEQAREGGLSGLDVARNEAWLLDHAFGRGRVPQDGARGGRDLRLHVGGDVADEASARVLASAAARWRLRGGGDVWTYTHRWREIPRKAWGMISVLASCESAEEVRAAQRRGYRASLTTVPGTFAGAKRQRVNGLQVVPCPWETRQVPCNKCRLCLHDVLPQGAVIGFAAHGSQHDVARAVAALEGKRRLPVLNAAGVRS